MKLVCSQSDLNTNLSLVSRAVPSRPTHLVLANVLLKADPDTQRVQLTAFDLSLGIQTSFPAQIESGGIFTLPAKLLNDIVSRLPDGEITLDDETDEGCVTLKSKSGRYKVRGMGAEDYPELPEISDGQAIQLPSEILIDGLRGSLFATSADETKQVLTGVHFKLQEDNLEFAATDGHRLSVVQSSTHKPDDEEEDNNSLDIEEFEVTVPAKALREVERMLGMFKATENISLNFDASQVVFEWGNQRITSRTLEGQYPNYRQLIPKQFDRQITVDRKQLLSGLERIAVLADQKNNVVKFTIDNDNQQMDLSVESQDVGSGKESVTAQVTGDSLDIAFNVKYLMDGLKALPSQEIVMKINTATSPVILTPLSGLKMTCLVMPVQLRS